MGKEEEGFGDKFIDQPYFLNGLHFSLCLNVSKQLQAPATIDELALPQ